MGGLVASRAVTEFGMFGDGRPFPHSPSSDLGDRVRIAGQFDDQPALVAGDPGVSNVDLQLEF
jgi:hypothetical protein